MTLLKDSKVPNLSVDSGVTVPSLQKHWPPPYLGWVPQAPTPPLQIHDLEAIDDHEHPEDNPLLAIWSATMEKKYEYEYLKLPRTSGKEESVWIDLDRPWAASDSLLVTEHYHKAFSQIFSHVNTNQKRMCHILLGGTAGIGKSYFARYFIWRLLHPDDQEVKELPHAILYCNDAKDPSGYLYYCQRFFNVPSMMGFLARSLVRNMFNHKNAWVICDGMLPSTYLHCPTLVISSWTSQEDANIKKYCANAFLKIYIPTWSLAQLIEVFAITSKGRKTPKWLYDRYDRYGGVPGEVFQLDPLELVPASEEFSDAEIIKAMDLAFVQNSQDGLCQIFHLQPSEDMQYPFLSWCSREIMFAVFDRMFSITSRKVECQLPFPRILQRDQLYDLFFEPYFYRAALTGNCSGHLRRLYLPKEEDRTLESIKKAKRHRISARSRQVVSKINPSSYPDSMLLYDEKAYSGVDCFIPDKGLIYIVSPEESHDVNSTKLDQVKSKFESFLKKNKKVKLIFVVPPELFEEYVVQSYRFPRWSSTSKWKLQGDIEKWVDQYALALSLDPLLSSLEHRGQ